MKKKKSKQGFIQDKKIEKSSLLLGGLGIILIILLLHISYFNFDHTIDDAYISFRYAKNLIQGYGLVYNPGEQVEGYTNLLWVLLVAPFIFLGQDPGYISNIFSIIFACFIVLITFSIAKRLIGTMGAFAAALFLVFNASFIIWITGGLETTLFGFLLILSIFLFFKEKFLLSGLVFGLSYLTRPEGLLFAFIAACFLLAKRNIKGALLFLFPFLSIFFSHFLFRFFYYHELLPNTFYAKVVPSNLQYQQGISYTKWFFITNFGIFSIFLFVFLFNCIKESWVLYLLVSASFFSFYITFVGGDSFPCFRFYAPVIPFFSLLIGASFKESLYVLKKKGKILCGLPIIVFILLLHYTASSRAKESNQNRDYIPLYEKVEKQREEIGMWFLKNLPKDTKIALGCAGIIPYWTDFYTIDILGLNDKHIAKQRSSGGILVGHAKFDSNYVLSKEPDLIIIGAAELLEGNPNIERVSGYYNWISKIVPASNAILANKKLFERYQLVALKIKEGFFLPLFLKRDSSIIPEGEKIVIFHDMQG